MDIVLAILLIIASVALVLFVVLQTGGKSSKLSQAIAGGSSDNYGEKNKARAKDKHYSRLTTITAVVFAVVVLVTAIYTNYLVKNAPATGDSTTEITTDAGTGEDTGIETGAETGAETDAASDEASSADTTGAEA